ncbi:MAG: helix-turn-helix transcriptional regulator [Rhodoferax sp.]|uniref:helix-turn-helix domain-containing protein n=1 Tax=Rhodoferax sp. TaxID=50421 RepID=UPI0013FF2D16|nr:helix-turn-helix transcriptional regulator [Rhodoferax sp.]NDP38775.1 helix-turn-helix transcriptional regulator [Rhodoferax sp.]
MKTATQPNNTYAPVAFDPGAEVARLKQTSPAFARAWNAQAEEFDALDALLEARKRAGLTQAQVADLMGVKQSSLARVEASLASHSHAPSLTTLRKYAQAVGCKLELRMVPQ